MTFKMFFWYSALLATIPSILVLRHYHVRGFYWQAAAFALAAVAGLVAASLLLLAIHLYVRIKNRNYVQEKPEESSREAERFYYLAVWAALTGKKAFGRRMLKQAKQAGFNDPVRLHDTAIEQIAV